MRKPPHNLAQFVLSVQESLRLDQLEYYRLLRGISLLSCMRGCTDLHNQSFPRALAESIHYLEYQFQPQKGWEEGLFRSTMHRLYNLTVLSIFQTEFAILTIVAVGRPKWYLKQSSHIRENWKEVTPWIQIGTHQQVTTLFRQKNVFKFEQTTLVQSTDVVKCAWADY